MADIARADVGTALKALALRLPQLLELLLQAVQLVICATLQRDKAGAGMLDRAEQFIQLAVQGARISAAESSSPSRPSSPRRRALRVTASSSAVATGSCVRSFISMLAIRTLPAPGAS